MSLYDDIDVPSTQNDERSNVISEASRNEEKTATPTNLSFLKAQLESKKAQVQFKLKSPTVGPSAFTSQIHQQIGPPSAKKPAGMSLLKSKRVQPLKIDASTTFSIIPKALKEDNVFLFNEIMVDDEYNPTAPTDYYSFKAKREARLARERMAREVAERLEKEHAEEIAKRGMGAAIAPPSILMETNDEVFEPIPTEEVVVSKKNVVSNIMSKMGYRQGFGLGKDQQGISTALQVKKIGKTSVIVDESKGFTEKFAGTSSTSSEEPPPINITELLKSASKIILVKNMALSSDVDSEFKNEITEEMSKYGQVVNVVIHLVEGSPENERVRIFVEFTNQAQAVKAVIDLNKRFFNGRSVRATFYSVEDFEAKLYEK